MKNQKFRYATQIFFLIIVLLFSVNHMIVEKGWTFLPSNPNLHSICPYGGIATLYTMITQDTLIKKIHTSSIVLMWGIIFLGVVLGGVFCGWICPFGTVQEFLGKLGKRIFKKRYNRFISKRVAKYLQYFRYIFLIIILYKTAETGTLFFNDYDPYHTLFSIWSDEIAIISYVILGITLLAGLIEERAWCKFACPFGGLNGLFNLFSIYKIRRNNSQCLDCDVCNNNCPMGIDVQNQEKIISTLCLRCGRCVSSCPAKNDTLEYQFGKFREVNS